MPKPKQGKKKIILGITGSFGSGKTTVAKLLKPKGAEIIDADKLAHQVITRGRPAYRRIIRIFGTGILKKNKQVNRVKLASLVFDHKGRLQKLNRIIHPEVIRMIKNKIKLSKSKVVILDAPLLVEAGLEKIVDHLIVVKINRREQQERIKLKFRLQKKDILKRIKSQLSLSRKMSLADFIIDNSGTRIETVKQISKIRRLLWKS
jgi:dephospho-CoA kinase